MSDIKHCFTSRFEGGSILEADYSQLEVIVLAHLSNDFQLKADLLSGMDMHRVRAAELFDIPEDDVTSKQRKIAKAFSFQLQYGAGAPSMAEKNEQPEALAKKFIENFYARYPDVKAWQERVKADVEASRRPSKKQTKLGRTAGVGFITSETGRNYVFFEDDNPYYNPSAKWGKSSKSATNFSPTKMKNYPVQGMATGDIVPMMLGELFEELMSHPEYKENVLLINTVHDSVMFDCKFTDERKIEEVGSWIKNIMEFAPTRLKEHFDIAFELPLTVEVEAGSTWGELKKLDI